jgi:hypothetical protein
MLFNICFRLLETITTFLTILGKIEIALTGSTYSINPYFG